MMKVERVASRKICKTVHESDVFKGTNVIHDRFALFVKDFQILSEMVGER